MTYSFSDLIMLLSTGITQRRLYFGDHPKVKSLGEDFTSQLADLLKDRGDTGFFFGILNGKFIHQGKYLVGPSIAGKPLIEFAGILGCGGFLFRRGLQPDEVASFFTLAAKHKDRCAKLSEAASLLASHGIVNIELSPHYREGITREECEYDELVNIDPGLIQFDLDRLDDFEAGDDEEVRSTLSKELTPLLPIFQSMYDTATTNNIHISTDKDLDIHHSREVGEELFNVSDRETLDVMNLMRYPDYDSYTVGHSVRVSTLALTVGREMGWPEEMLPELATAGLLHDVGKAKVPDEILYKPGRLTAEELKIAEMHAAVGAQILLAKGDASPLVVAGAWGHHIRHDGGGYPQVPDWVTPSPIAGLIQICDVFEALTAARPYKPPMSPRRAFEIILKDRTAFHPSAVTALIRAIGLYPVGSEIILTSGERGFVVAKSGNWDRPVVRISRDKHGEKLSKSEQYTLDLAREPLLGISDFMMVNLSNQAPDLTETLAH